MTVPCITSSVSLAEGRFLKMERLEFEDAKGKRRQWEAVQRQKNQAAVFIIATLQPSGRVVLIRQFRAPVGHFCIEVPAGLIDAGETPAQAATRELIEETGYVGRVEWVGPASASSAGLTGELVTTVFMTIDETQPENSKPVAKPDEGEDIEVIVLPMSGLCGFFKERIAAGDVPDSRLVAWALGLGVRW